VVRHRVATARSRLGFARAGTGRSGQSACSRGGGPCLLYSIKAGVLPMSNGARGRDRERG
jgi:hypothetical protein